MDSCNAYIPAGRKEAGKRFGTSLGQTSFGTYICCNFHKTGDNEWKLRKF